MQKTPYSESNFFAVAVIAVLMAVLAVAILSMVWPRGAVEQDKPVVVQDALYAEDQAGNSMRLNTGPCIDGKVLALAERMRIPKRYFDGLQAGLMRYEGKDYGACWVVGPDGFVYVFDESGDMGKIPMQMFKRRDGA